jgi:hypothetical protein
VENSEKKYEEIFTDPSFSLSNRFVKFQTKAFFGSKLKFCIDLFLKEHTPVHPTSQSGNRTWSFSPKKIHPSYYYGGEYSTNSLFV